MVACSQHRFKSYPCFGSQPTIRRWVEGMVYHSGRRDWRLSEAVCESWVCAEVPGLRPGSSVDPKFRLPYLWVLLDLMAEAAEMLRDRGQR